MKNKKQFRISIILLLSFLSGCNTHENQSYRGFDESRMSVVWLRSQVLRYKAEVEKEDARIDKLLSEECPDYDFNAPFTSKTLERLERECPKFYGAMIRSMDSHVDHYLSYYSFYEKLKEKGGDMSGLEIDEDSLIHPKLLLPPIEEPQVPTPETKIKANT